MRISFTVHAKCCVPKEDGNLLVLLSNSFQLDIDIFYVTYELHLATVDSTHCRRYMFGPSPAKWNGNATCWKQSSLTADSLCFHRFCSSYRSWHLRGFPRCPQISAPMLSGWWLNQPIWKICSSNWKASPVFRVKIKNVWVATTQLCFIVSWNLFSTFWGDPENPDFYVFPDDSWSKTLQAMRPDGHDLNISSFSLHVAHCIVMHRPCSSFRNFAGKWQYHCWYKPKPYCWVLLEEWFASFFLSDINSIIRLHHSADRFVRST